ncbi:MAG: NADH-quinone oxidoreductase subunit NuoF [Gracilibacteraceae bacterium]|jgi:NADH:ubiquinone oxidoreductase subunit F (NADH-binding)/(2Fe-2S) ferredoxin/NAD-dependent dihydropyrimidine dehydrogenase PreA subunit|nr:NADH-quinone oxidoreductase subunit NuoF [Gracilibacteraceae bacterium]
MLTLENLNELRQKTLTRSNLDDKRQETRVVVGLATCGIAAGAQPVFETLKAETAAVQGVNVYRAGCIGACRLEPLVEVYEPGRAKVTYTRVTPEKAKEIAARHIIGKTRLDEYSEELDFTGQLRIALRNCGIIDPEDINEYIARDGYQALAKALSDMKPLEVIETIKKSGLRGRGGAGFPTGLKWQFAAQNESDQKYVCCNADEGDPGAFMDRSVLEGDPHAVLEAMAIAGYAIGSTKGFIYIRAEYPVAVKRLDIAITQAKALGLLGENIFGSGFSFDIELRLGAGAFVCGEETALMTSIEGKRGEPRPRPPFPAAQGLWRKPTILNNVETFANIAQIILNGAEWFAGIGTERSKGTKVFALGGKINNTGLIEVPMGTPLRFIIEQIGGGIPGGRAFKAAQTGGPSGGCIPAVKIDTPIEYETLLELGSMMGSGGLIVIDEDNCMVDVARFFLDFTVDESCGKCPPCRIGTKRMLELLGKITSGRGEAGDIEKLESLAALIKRSALCGLGQTAPNPVLSTLRYFRREYEEHIRDNYCAAVVCKAMICYEIDAEKCIRCNLCKRNCPSGAVTGGKDVDYVIDRDACIKCGLCVSKCRSDAIKKKNC